MKPIANLLLPWFERHGRHDLPWQRDIDGYRVWLSEIMLQQTQVSTVIPYFERFLDSFPDIRSLADAPLDDVLHHWAGLGYYARARNLHRAAQQVRDQHAGCFPDSFDAIEALPGVGRSTAGAILSLAFGQPAAILDGNVKRVLARVFQVPGWSGQTATLKQLWQLAEEHTPEQHCNRYNQAMMDLGATLCTRGRPRCNECPLQEICASHAKGTQSLYPQPRPRRKSPLKHRWLLVHRHENRLLLEKRQPSGIWGGLWSFPELEDLAQLTDWQHRTLGLAQAPQSIEENALLHRFTHFDLNLSLACVRLQQAVKQGRVGEQSDYHWVNLGTLDSHAFPTPVQTLVTQLRKDFLA